MREPSCTFSATQEKPARRSSSPSVHGPGKSPGLSMKMPAPSKTVGGAAARAAFASAPAQSTAATIASPVRTYRPLKSGFRFSTNACRPSCASSEERTTGTASGARNRGPASSGVSKDWRGAPPSRASRIASGRARRDLPRPAAAPRRGAAPSRATTREQRPAASASCAVRKRPASTTSIASDLPTARVRRCVPAAPGMMPRFVSGWPKRGVVGGDDDVARHRELAADHPGRSRRRPRSAASRRRLTRSQAERSACAGSACRSR